MPSDKTHAESLEEALERPTVIRSIHFGGERATRFTIDARAAAFTSLESVHFGSNHPDFEGAFGLEHLASVPTLRHVGLSLGRRVAPDEGLYRLTQIRELHLRGDFDALPTSLGRLQRLRFLEIASVRLTVLPESIGELATLDKLSLRGCRLETLPRTIGGLARLRELFLEDNRLAELPDAIADLPSLETLLLGRNRLVSVPASVARLPRLTLLDLRQNTPLREVPADLLLREDLRLEVEPEKLPASARDVRLGLADRAFARLEARAAELERPAFRFVTHPGDGGLTDSKVGGEPWLAPGESAPTCRVCAESLALFVQIDLALAGEGHSGLLQVFGCARLPSVKRLAVLAAKDDPAVSATYREHLRALFGHLPVDRVRGIADRARAWRSTDEDRAALEACRVGGNALEYTLRFSCRELVEWGPPSVFHARVIDAERVRSAGARSVGARVDGPSPRRIVRLVPSPDRPSPDDLGIENAWTLVDALTAPQRKRVDEWTIAGDKLFGHPRWLQERAFHECLVCGKETSQLVLALEGADDDLFGGELGGATLYVTRCAEHAHALRWDVQNG